MSAPLTHTPAPGAKPPLLLARGVTKAFDRTRALAGADLEVREREIHGLLGASGAGKSILSMVIAGHCVFDAGEITYRSYPVKLRSPREALRVGIAIVMQEACLAPDLTALDNIFLPELGRPGRLDHAAMRQRGLALLASLGQAHAVPLDREARRLSSAQRQLVGIARALGGRAKLIVLDDPTAALSAGEADRLFDVMTRLRRSGRGLVFASRRIEEVLAVADRVTIMREGRTVLNGSAATSLTRGEARRAMVGAEGGAVDAGPHARSAAGQARVALEVRGLSAPPAVRDVSFAARCGEILGLGGLAGAGGSESVEAIFGLRRRGGGTVLVDGNPLPPFDPRAAIRAGLGLVPGDWRRQNIVPDLSVGENLLLAHLGARRGVGLGVRSRDAGVEVLLKKLGLPEQGLREASMLALPGGTQRKIIMARWLLLGPRILILDEPTRGVDLATRAVIHATLRAVAAEGVAVVLASSDVEELLDLSDRVVAISDGRSIADVPSAVLDGEKLTLLAAPRGSVDRNTALLRDLTDENGGAGFWALIDDKHLICLNAVVADRNADPGFKPGEARTLDATRIPQALRRRADVFVHEADNSRATVLVPIRTPRGRGLGWVGLTLPAHGLPPAAAIRHRVETLAAMP